MSKRIYDIFDKKAKPLGLKPGDWVKGFGEVSTYSEAEFLNAAILRLHKIKGDEFIRGWKAGYAAGLVKDRNVQCACAFDDAGETLVRVCAVHREYIEKHLVKLFERVVANISFEEECVSK